MAPKRSSVQPSSLGAVHNPALGELVVNSEVIVVLDPPLLIRLLRSVVVRQLCSRQCLDEARCGDPALGLVPRIARPHVPHRSPLLFGRQGSEERLTDLRTLVFQGLPCLCKRASRRQVCARRSWQAPDSRRNSRNRPCRLAPRDRLTNMGPHLALRWSDSRPPSGPPPVPSLPARQG